MMYLIDPDTGDQGYIFPLVTFGSFLSLALGHPMSQSATLVPLVLSLPHFVSLSPLLYFLFILLLFSLLRAKWQWQLSDSPVSIWICPTITVC